MDTYIVQLTEDESKLFRKPIRGQGGFQDLLQELRLGLTSDNKITLTSGEIRKIRRYAEDYGVGGFQGRLWDGLMKAISALVLTQILFEGR